MCQRLVFPHRVPGLGSTFSARQGTVLSLVWAGQARGALVRKPTKARHGTTPAKRRVADRDRCHHLPPLRLL